MKNSLKKDLNRKACFKCKFFLRDTDVCRECERENIKKGKPCWELDDFFKAQGANTHEMQ